MLKKHMHVAALLGTAGCSTLLGFNEPQHQDAGPDAQVQLPAERGQYIANVLSGCSSCHTPLLPNGAPDTANLFAGVDCYIDYDSPDLLDDHNGTGCVSTSNLTNHATGLANASDDAIKKAIRDGVRIDGKKMLPMMPFWIFHNMTDADADAVVAYLRLLPGKDHNEKANESPFSDYNNGSSTSIPDIAPILPSQIPLPSDGESNAAAMRGRYLSSMVGLCIDCHTPELTPGSGQPDVGKLMTGGRVFPKGMLGVIDTQLPAFIVSRNLTPDSTGLGGWSTAQIKAAILEGRDRDNQQVCAAVHSSAGSLLAPSGGRVTHPPDALTASSSYAGIKEQDLDDIATYLSSIAPVGNDTAAQNCGVPAIGNAEAGPQCSNGTDDDGDSLPDDGCYVACGNCAGPQVP